jgi:hypothetical protein
MKSLLASEHILALTKEESVRGVLVRKVLDEAEKAEEEGVMLLEKALQLLLTRFQSMDVEKS